MKWQPKDVIACIIVLGCIALKCLGHDDVVSWSLLAVVGAYYGLDLSPWVKIGRNQKPKKEGDE
ncbi:hypothetical protein ES707_15422 [subsurface metagenome]